MTDAELRNIEEWLDNATTPCGNDACVGEWADVHGKMLVAEVKRLRELLKQHDIDPNGDAKPYEPEPYDPPKVWAIDENAPKGTVRFVPFRGSRGNPYDLNEVAGNGVPRE